MAVQRLRGNKRRDATFVFGSALGIVAALGFHAVRTGNWILAAAALAVAVGGCLEAAR